MSQLTPFLSIEYLWLWWIILIAIAFGIGSTIVSMKYFRRYMRQRKPLKAVRNYLDEQYDEFDRNVADLENDLKAKIGQQIQDMRKNSPMPQGVRRATKGSSSQTNTPPSGGSNPPPTSPHIS